MQDIDNLKALFIDNIQLFKQICIGKGFDDSQILQIVKNIFIDFLNGFQWVHIENDYDCQSFGCNFNWLSIRFYDIVNLPFLQFKSEEYNIESFIALSPLHTIEEIEELLNIELNRILIIMLNN